MQESTVLVTRDGDVVTLTLNRPTVLNSLCLRLYDDLMRALDDVERDDTVRCVVLTGSGRGFCAGQDLGEPGVIGAPDAGAVLESHYNPMMLRLRGLALPLICAVNGVAAGAGASLALVGDIVIAARSARFIQAFVRIGLVPDCGATWFLPRLIGDARARALALTGDTLGAEDAAAWGLIWRCVDDDALADETRSLAARLATLPTRAIALTKHALQAGMTQDLPAQLELERHLQREAGQTADAREGITAFLDKRAPRFTGR